MIPVPIKDATRTYGPPEGWNPDLDGPCATITIRDEVDLQTAVKFMAVAFKPEPEDLAILAAGGSFVLRIAGTGFPLISLQTSLEDDA